MSQFNLARCFELGVGTMLDEYQAVDYFRLAAVQNYAASQRSLAEHYAEGRGTSPNRMWAAFWYCKACCNRRIEVSLKIKQLKLARVSVACFLFSEFGKLETEIVELLLDPNDRTKSELYEAALDFLTTGHYTEIQMIVSPPSVLCAFADSKMNSFSAYHDFIATINALPLPIAEEIVPNFVSLCVVPRIVQRRGSDEIAEDEVRKRQRN